MSRRARPGFFFARRSLFECDESAAGFLGRAPALSAALETPNDVAHLVVGVAKRALQFLAQVVVQFVAPRLERLEFLAHDFAVGLGLRPQPLGFSPLALDRHAALVQRRQGLFELAVFAIEQFVGAIQNLLGQTHPRGDRRRRRGPGASHPEAEGGCQCLGVEFKARVLETRVDVRHLLEQVVVGGGDHARAARRQGLEHGLGDRRALARVGTVSNFV